ncbi:hypothetical protein BURK2_02573 [Burkholderiales bacterium]|nr:hypothetical protein BURK2_02573 [Burkholderiales bacterium]
MNLSRSLATLALCIAAGAAGAAGAQTYSPHIDQRETSLQARISQGVASGSLTPAEAAWAQQGLWQIHAYEALAKSDGVVTRFERRHLEQMENRESRQLARMKHNRRHI